MRTTAAYEAGVARLRELHRPGDPLVLPNVWDVASARAVQDAGFPAVATSSAAVAEALGYADGEAAPAAQMLAAVARVAASVTVPVTADLERGYGMVAGELVERLAATGAVGCNLEDSDPASGTMIDPTVQAEFLAQVRQAAGAAGMVINARVDTFLHGMGTPRERLADALARTRAYLAAGADCVYPILAVEPDAIRSLVGAAGGAVNVLYRDSGPALPELARLGVARISYGPGLFRGMQAQLATALAGIREQVG